MEGGDANAQDGQDRKGRPDGQVHSGQGSHQTSVNDDGGDHQALIWLDPV
jgi:hypothetical protein